MRRAPLLLAALVALLAPALARAEEPTVRAEVNARKLGVEDQLVLSVTLQASSLQLTEEISAPQVQNLRLVGGPSIQTSISLANGAMTQGKTYTYVYQPLAPGKAEIGAIRAKFTSGDKVTPPISIEVVPGNVLPQRQGGGNPHGLDPWGGEDPFEDLFGRRRQAAPRAEPKIFVEAAPSRTRVHVGEPVLLTYYLYLQASVTGMQFGEAPKYAGFWVEDIPRAKDEQPKGETVQSGGESYRRFEIFQKLLYPTKAGTLEIPASSVKLGIQRRSGFFFDPSPGASIVERQTKPVKIQVDPIPEEPGFTGAVGKFRVTATLDKPTLPIGEAATLRFQVEGSGNLKWVDRAPEVIVKGAKVYAPQVKSDLRTAPTGIAGTKTWEFVIVPETAGALEIPALAFPFFDPEAKTVVRGETRPIPFQVVAGAGGATTLPTPTAPAASPTVRGGPAPLRSDLDEPTRRIAPLSGEMLGILAALVLLAHLGLWGGPRIREALAARGGDGRPRRGRKSLRGPLSEIARAGKGGLSKEAAAVLIEKALVEVFGEVDQAGAATDGEKAALALLQEVRFIRYAPQLGDYGDKIREVAEQASDVVRRWG